MKTVSLEKPLDVVREEIRADADKARQRASTQVRRKPAIVRAAPSVSAATDAGVGIAQLCHAHAGAFVRQAYSVLLRRPPDPAGFARHLQMLASGHSKVEILGNLRWSAEGRDNAVRVAGLLPRYAMAKAMRVPLLGYALEWLIALAGLPRILRHQRAADTYHTTQYEALGEQSRAAVEELASREASDCARIDQQAREHLALIDRLSAGMRELQEGIERDSAQTRELRHLVLSMNHWLTSLRQNLSALESTDAERQREADAWAADVAAQVMANDSERAGRLESLAHAFAENLPSAALVLDLCSGEDWLARLVERGINVAAIDTSAQIALRASTPGVSVAAADPAAVLARTAAASLDGVSLLDTAAVLRQIATASFLDDLHRVLRAEGRVLFAFEAGPTTIAHRLQGRSESALDSGILIAALKTSGFTEVRVVPAAGPAAAILARRGNRPA